MTLGPGYGETPAPCDELDSLLPPVLAVLGEPITKATLFDVV
jgi:hypothetical protein